MMFMMFLLVMVSAPMTGVLMTWLAARRGQYEVQNDETISANRISSNMSLNRTWTYETHGKD